MSRLERFRANRDHFFQSHPDSPLLPAQRLHFTGLRYYPESDKLRFEVQLDDTGVNHEPVALETTTGEHKHFVPAGRVRVTIEGREASLLLYKEHGRGRYFLPFRDATSGVETYYLGRYLDPQATPRGTVIVDFNYAYNPYCAYNEGWSCPIPPRENRLDMPVRAGEQIVELERSAAA